MALEINETQHRLTHETYNSAEHLIKIKGKDGVLKDYLPANWRLHELRVTYPTATIESEIVHMNEEKNFVIIKAIIFDGKTYEESARRATSFKQGMLSALDKVETGAKSRAARDFGIGTEFALEQEDEEDLDTPPTGEQVNRTATKKAPASKQTQQNGHAQEDGPATEQQLASIANLAKQLKKSTYDLPKTYTQASTLLKTFSEEYREARQAARLN